MKLEKQQKTKLKNVAAWERALSGKIYPAGSSTIQLSATKGQIGFLLEAGEVETKEAVIVPNDDINPKYFNFVLRRNVDEFCSKYQTGLNIKVDEIGEFPIELHERGAQDELVRLLEWIDEESALVEKEISNAKETKRTLLERMFA